MRKRNSSDFDVYMARLREAEECPPEKRTEKQEELLSFMSGGPSFNSLFPKRKDGRS